MAEEKEKSERDILTFDGFVKRKPELIVPIDQALGFGWFLDEISESAVTMWFNLIVHLGKKI